LYVPSPPGGPWSNGQRETLNGEVLDGRNRWRACVELNLTPRIEELPSGTDPIRYVVTRNLRRRHLTDSQRAWIAAKIANMTNGSNQYEKKVGLPNGTPTQSPISVAQAAEMLNVSERNVRRAKRVQEHRSPQVQKDVEEGHMSLHHAADLQPTGAETTTVATLRPWTMASSVQR
jgi:hypothetical protein